MSEPTMTPPQVPHVGAPELYELGHALLAMFTYDSEPTHPTTFLTLQEHPERHYDQCPACDFSRVPGGDFKLTHQHKRLGVKLPYVAAHLLAAHGYAPDPNLLADIDTLRELLNLDERALGQRVVGIASMAAPEPSVGVDHQQVKGSHCCKHCNDRLNMGTVTLLHGKHKLALSYLGLHTLYEHGDSHWADTDGNSGEIDLDALRELLDSGSRLVELGKRLASMLPFLGGTTKPPAWLLIDEHPMRGIEQCQRCAATPNMGYFNLTDTRTNSAMTLPYIAVHSLIEHASAHYVGSLHRGRVKVVQLARMLGLERD